MIHRAFNYSILLLLPLLLSACLSTPPSHYYLLSAHDGDQPTGVNPSVGIGPISLPEYLNRNSMVYRREDNQLQIAGYERWAEPLTDGILRVIGLNLAMAFTFWFPMQDCDHDDKNAVCIEDNLDTQTSFFIGAGLAFLP